jgi:hypothetical protein
LVKEFLGILGILMLLFDEDKGKRTDAKREMPVSWQMRKGRGGPKKKIETEGYFA